MCCMRCDENDGAVLVICEECNKRYRSDPKTRAQMTSWRGLCPKCRSELRYWRFFRTLCGSLGLALISLEWFILVFFLVEWPWLLTVGLVWVSVLLAVYGWVRAGERVSYANIAERRRLTRGQRLLAHAVAGIMVMGSLMALLSLRGQLG